MIEFSEDLGCDVRGEIADDLFHKIENEPLKDVFETPFKVNLFNTEVRNAS